MSCKLENIKIERDRTNSDYLKQVEMDIREELGNVLHHEEVLWRQKAHCDWLVLGDRNTNSFHTSTLRRPKQNRITSLKNGLDEWIMDDEQLKLEAVNFYSTLYGEHLGSRKDFHSSAFPGLNDEDFNYLNRPVSNEEIKIGLFHMTPLKALGSDGYHALFYQSRWKHVSDSVKGIFEGRNITDNIVIAQEVIHSMRGTQKNMKCMAIKIYLEKAYDRVR
ncbi:Retrovirus-related Pol polyprotein LINE-1 [Gossypium australe]|uniref:Retrovirus-related Pol polyprotein LINE-1 n=1 Tax=Gossypium australe TaxID=47621 RepID=A0A5B6VXG0_9ROSI|nr:Retrovirus-related Pol polyprotein LINE-1 [Gossypium australe]